MNSVYDKVSANQPICNVLYKVIATINSIHLLFLIESGWVGRLEIIETSSSSQKQNWDCIVLNLEEKTLPKIYANSGKNSAIARYWAVWFKRWNFLFNMDNLHW